MKTISDKRGQFILIAALMVSILIVSISAIMYGTVTYFKHERWEEYLSLIDTLKISSRRVVEISLANYTWNLNNATILRDNLNKWRINITRVYSGFGVVLNPHLTNGSYQAYNLTLSYTLGLAYNWYAPISHSAANVTVEMNITSIGLNGYKFIAVPLVREEILSAVYDISDKSLTVKLAVDKEGLMPITNLQGSSFSLSINISGTWQSVNFSFSRYYDSSPGIERFVYELYTNNLVDQPSEVSVTVRETRYIKVVANSTVTQTS